MYFYAQVNCICFYIVDIIIGYKMATFKAEIQNKRADGTYNLRIRITHNREIKRLSTNIYVTSENLTRAGKIKNQKILDQC